MGRALHRQPHLRPNRPAKTSRSVSGVFPHNRQDYLRLHHARSFICHGFVGEKSELASEYHDSDFDWEERFEEVAPLLTVEDGGSWPNLDHYDFSCWEDFHQQHGKGRFFKERRYITLEFPQLLLQSPPQHFVEIGCGCGSSILPVLNANPTCSVTACDVSPSALGVLEEAARKLEICESRVETVVLDAGVVPSKSNQPLGEVEADAVLVVFTMSALPFELMPNLLAHANSCLKPGGCIFVRDYGYCDMTQLRYPTDQRLGDQLYRRSDGTLAFYFKTEDLNGLMRDAGFSTEQCSYACVTLKNRKKGREMKRVFVHGVFRKPSS